MKDITTDGNELIFKYLRKEEVELLNDRAARIATAFWKEEIHNILAENIPPNRKLSKIRELFEFEWEE